MKQILLGILVSLFYMSSNLSGNSSSYYAGDGGSVFPIENKNIQMKKEIVKIKTSSIGNDIWEAECIYFFYNKIDSEQVVTMGYPNWLDFKGSFEYSENKDIFYSYFSSDSIAHQKILNDNKRNLSEYSKIYYKGYTEGKLPYIKNLWKIRDIKVIINEKIITTKHMPIKEIGKVEKEYLEKFHATKKELEILGAFIWEVKFKPKESIIVNVKFNFEGLSGLNKDDMHCQEVTYLLKTGKLWADKIEVADIFWDVSNSDIAEINKITPKNYKEKNKVLHWHFENFEPEEDISLFIKYGDY